ncbi:hypothetical protein [Streptomonospora halophila]|uniref:hypothetical protein n=1 Tax=Streptomonospora halophila TaxID=427369 RepID=UPI0031EB8F8F
MWMVPVAAGLGVVMMAGTVWAATSVAQNVFVGAQPESVLPGSSIAFAKLDLRPSGGQLAGYTQFVNRLPDSMRDEIDPDADPAKELVDSYIDEAGLDGMSYEEDFEPWLGRHFGFAMWVPDSEEAATERGGTTMAIAIEAEDEEAAEAALDEIRSATDEDTAFDVRDDFAILAPNSAALSDLESQVESEGSLEDLDTYNQDMEAIGTENVASAWMDLGQLASTAAEDSGSGTGGYGLDEYGGVQQPDPMESLGQYEDVSGRMAVGLRIEPEYMEVRGDTFGLTVDGVSTADYDLPDPGLQLMGDLPDDTVFAVGGSGAADMMGQAYEQNPEELSDLEDLMSELGLTMPDGLTSLLGERTALGITDLGGSVDEFFGGATGPPSLQYRAEGADSQAVQNAIDTMWENSYTTPPGVTSEGSVTVATSGTTGTGRLGDDAVFKQTMAGTESAHMGMYLDLRPVAESAEESAPEQWGAVGASVTFDAETMSMRARWAPNGGG